MAWSDVELEATKEGGESSAAAERYDTNAFLQSLRSIARGRVRGTA
jgi:hypothetical protein